MALSSAMHRSWTMVSVIRSLKMYISSEGCALSPALATRSLSASSSSSSVRNCTGSGGGGGGGSVLTGAHRKPRISTDACTVSASLLQTCVRVQKLEHVKSTRSSESIGSTPVCRKTCSKRRVIAVAPCPSVIAKVMPRSSGAQRPMQQELGMGMGAKGRAGVASSLLSRDAILSSRRISGRPQSEKPGERIAGSSFDLTRVRRRRLKPLADHFTVRAQASKTCAAGRCV
mmetsp:Transcript_7900/g.23431  ORF Transcript_7900/g.23431 Transcript_7900/m.23431 type:complete len:230 (+) Transcript_7900:700-1389(+)